MRVTIFVKTFLTLLITFSLVFFLIAYTTNQKFADMYIDENITAVQETIISSASEIKNGADLRDTELFNLSSETTFIRLTDNVIVEEIGPSFLEEADIIFFVIDILDNEETIKQGNLSYYRELKDDIHSINYIYEYGQGDYLIVATKIQSLTNIDKVLNNINQTQSISMFIAIALLSILISLNFSRPIKKINNYAKDISNLDFSSNLKLKRNDEFKDLISSLNEMTFNLKKSYQELNKANLKLTNDIDFEKQQEQKKKNLIYTINHELKTPLAVMRGMIEGMIDGVGRYKDKDKYLGELLTQIEQIENIAKDLTYSLKLEDKASQGDITNAESTVDHLRPLFEFASQRKIKMNHDIQNGSILINEELYTILITNLVKNALIYTTDKVVFIKTEIKNNNYILTIRNKGFIKDEDLDKIFESFYRSDSLNINKSGSGLGLYIVKQICDLYGYECKLFNDNGFVTAKVIMTLKSH